MGKGGSGGGFAPSQPKSPPAAMFGCVTEAAELKQHWVKVDSCKRICPLEYRSVISRALILFQENYLVSAWFLKLVDFLCKMCAN